MAARAASYALPMMMAGSGAALAQDHDAGAIPAPTPFSANLQDASALSGQDGVLYLAQAGGQDNAPVVTAPQGGNAVAEAGTQGAGFSLAAPLTIGPVTFGAPWVLLGFLSFPLLWRLMRSTPPVPRQEVFPPIRLLFNLKAEDQEPAKMPLWQRLMRLALAGTLITALSDPNMQPQQAMTGESPVIILVDNGWASAEDWQERQRQITYLIERAEQENRAVSLIATALPDDGGALIASPPVSAADARDVLAQIEPQPWPVDRAAALQALEDMQDSGALPAATVYWLSNGLEDDLTAAFGDYLEALGQLNIYLPDAENAPFILAEPSYEGDILRVDVQRAAALNNEGEEVSVTLTAYDERGRPLMQAPVTFAAEESVQTAEFRVPVEVRNEIARIGINGERHAGATLLMDERWRLRPVGIFSDEAGQGAQSLLREESYVGEALDPHADVTRGSVEDILGGGDQSVIVMPDSASVVGGDRARLLQWVENGGTLLRFAGSRLASEAAQGQDDPLLPVELRPSVRRLDQNFAGAQPLGIGGFAEDSPLADIAVRRDVQVMRQLLPEPGADLNEHVWATLEDGTPLITARQIGEGWSILIHTTANTEWSNLVLSGMFIDILRGVVAHSQGLENGMLSAGAFEPPLESLDTDGRLVPPPSSAQPITADVVRNGEVSPSYPAGFYGTESAKYAHNLSAGVNELQRLDTAQFTGNVSFQDYSDAFNQTNLKGYLLTAAFMLAIADLGVMLGQRGVLPLQRRRRKTSATVQIKRPMTP